MKKIAISIICFAFFESLAFSDDSNKKFIIVKQNNDKKIIYSSSPQKSIGAGTISGKTIRTGQYCNKRCVKFITNKEDDGALVVLLEE
jgi:hypothetical protein